jgi:hypothetical protein
MCPFTQVKGKNNQVAICWKNNQVAILIRADNTALNTKKIKRNELTSSISYLIEIRLHASFSVNAYTFFFLQYTTSIVWLYPHDFFLNKAITSNILG